MADASLKELKLAAARKKLRKFQKKKDGKKVSSESQVSSFSEGLMNLRNEASSSHSSSVTDISEAGSTSQNHIENESSSLQDSLIGESLVSQLEVGYNGSKINIDSKPTYFSVEVPYESQSEVLVGNQTDLASGPHSHLSSYDDGHLHDNSVQALPIDMVLESKIEKNPFCDRTGRLEPEVSEYVSVMTVLPPNNKGLNVEFTEKVPLISTREMLTQLSFQGSSLISHSNEQNPTGQEETMREVEKRNDFASLLELERQRTLQQNLMIEYMKRTMENQSMQMEALQKSSVLDSNQTEIHGLREQLQVHIQTIGVLVAEKSELQASLSHTRYSLDQKAGEVSELQECLDSSKDYARNLEATGKELKAHISELTASQDSESQQMDALNASKKKLSKLNEELQAANGELTERLALRSKENQKLTTELADLKNEYELAKLHVEQLRSNSNEDMMKQFEQLQLSYCQSQDQVRITQVALDKAIDEKRQLEYDYKSYTNQITKDMENMKQKLESEVEKREAWEAKATKLESKLKSLEVDSEVRVALQEALEERARLQEEVAGISKDRKVSQEKCASLAQDNVHLSQLLAEQGTKLEALEVAADRHSSQEVDTSQLLQTMQSDKVAVTRALLQNKQLKEQLEELQNGFIMMSNKKLELTEKLERELHLKKGLYQEISRLNEDSASHKRSLMLKQRESSALKHSFPATTECVLPMLAANGEYGIEGLQQREHSHELEHETCLHEKTLLEQSFSFTHSPENATNKKDAVLTPVECLQEAIGESVSDGHPKEDSIDSASLESQTKKEESGLVMVSSNEAHEALERRFLQCMRELGVVSDEKQNLEHLVQQLQLETETIGDYITIYQFQRGVMKQQMHELQTELAMLKTEKEDIVFKLSKLQKLVEDLVNGGGSLKEGFIYGLNSIIDSTAENGAIKKESPERTRDVHSEGITEATDIPDPNPGLNARNLRQSKTDTVQQIMELINEMEASTQLDVSTLYKFHPCSQCSGRLITI